MEKSDLQIRLRHVRKAEEDWTKEENQAQRKRLQNRLAQRKTRELRRSRTSKTSISCSSKKVQDPVGATNEPTTSTDLVTPTTIPSTASRGSKVSVGLRILSSVVDVGLSEHRFVCLTQYSSLRALRLNMTMLGLDTGLFEDDDAVSPWTIFNPLRPRDPAFQSCSLMPTLLQLQTWHHPYIDLVPSPSLRDNMLTAALDDSQEDQLCYDLHLSGFTVWGSVPWDPMSWEVSEEFAERWSWLIDPDTIRYSNFWRASRGDQPLRLKGAPGYTTRETGADSIARRARKP
ncbi:hypothetical protein MMC13_004282 [Lambiella insularis]|nr:hypothetical protein [Lambiella insularis]